MEWSKISACYHPTTIVFVDDNSKYLSKLLLMIDVERASPKTFDAPKETLEFLKNYTPNSFTHRCISRIEEDQFDHRNFNINIGQVHAQVFNPNRFDEISVLVVDYSMPSLTGAELCMQLKDAPYKKLMLTGEADEETAIKLFNNGIIDRFIRKDSPDFPEIITANIQELQQNYFLRLSQPIVDSLTQDLDHPIVNWLDEPIFLKLFNEICRENNIIEYYLIDAFGSFLLLDFEGKPSWLAVKGDGDMQAAFEVAEASDNSFPIPLLEKMYNRELLLYLPRGGLCDDPDEAVTSLHPAKKLQGLKTNYYYTLIKNPYAYDINQNKIFSYKAYREKEASTMRTRHISPARSS